MTICSGYSLLSCIIFTANTPDRTEQCYHLVFMDFIRYCSQFKRSQHHMLTFNLHPCSH
ncbi:hypothetical protein MAR_036387 [Mya arenaria]|uniref:Uncharacterized protein n=1 Tax=Mya arenaria TaxID=6604 RepID=A0ABY7FPU3_MYAAR|nr:hypothetical protein MAR_036387 [Mya arenaria]